MRTIILLFMIVIALSSFTCNKYDQPKSRLELITELPWVTNSQRWNPNNTGWTDFNAPSCLKDNILTLYTNLTTITDEGATKCNITDPQTAATGVWVLYDNSTRFTITNAGDKKRYYEIIQLDDQVLKVIHRDTIAPSINIYENTLRH